MPWLKRKLISDLIVMFVHFYYRGLQLRTNDRSEHVRVSLHVRLALLKFDVNSRFNVQGRFLSVGCFL